MIQIISLEISTRNETSSFFYRSWNFIHENANLDLLIIQPGTQNNFYFNFHLNNITASPRSKCGFGLPSIIAQPS